MGASCYAANLSFLDVPNFPLIIDPIFSFEFHFKKLQKLQNSIARFLPPKLELISLPCLLGGNRNTFGNFTLLPEK